MAEVERKHILETIREVGDVHRAAEVLGVGKTKIYRRLKKWGVRTDGKRGQVIEPARALRATPVPRFLLLPRTREELAAANLKCPACKATVLLPNEVIR